MRMAGKNMKRFAVHRSRSRFLEVMGIRSLNTCISNYMENPVCQELVFVVQDYANEADSCRSYLAFCEIKIVHSRTCSVPSQNVANSQISAEQLVNFFPTWFINLPWFLSRYKEPFAQRDWVGCWRVWRARTKRRRGAWSTVAHASLFVRYWRILDLLISARARAVLSRHRFITSRHAR